MKKENANLEAFKGLLKAKEKNRDFENEIKKLVLEKTPEELARMFLIAERERYANLKAGIFLSIVACTFPVSSSVSACKASSASFDMSLSTGVSFRRSNGT